jgi:citrate synthase
MRIGKQDAPYSAICTSDAESITVRGRDLVGEVIGKMDFTSYFWLLVTGQEPNEDQAFFMNAMLCALAEHGLVPSVVAARMTLAAAPEATQGAVAAGLLGCGSVCWAAPKSLASFTPSASPTSAQAATILPPLPRATSPRCARPPRRSPASATRNIRAATRAPTGCSSSPTSAVCRASTWR